MIGIIISVNITKSNILKPLITYLKAWRRI